MLGPKSEKKEESAFEEKEELQPYCKFCFAKKFKVSILNIQETVNTMPETCGVSLWNMLGDMRLKAEDIFQHFVENVKNIAQNTIKVQYLYQNPNFVFTFQVVNWG